MADQPARDQSTPADTVRRDSSGVSQEAGRPAGGPAEPRLNRLARRAHEIYEARGGGQGRALDDWLQAEREIDAELEEQEADETGRTG
jgi:hypothetical protein